MRKLLIYLISAFLVLGAMGTVAADGDDDKRDVRDQDKRAEKDDKNDKGKDHKEKGKKASFDKHGNKYLLRNEHVSVWFHVNKDKAKPDLRVTFPGADNETSGYRVQIKSLYEAAPDSPGERAGPRMNLAKATEWNVVTTERADGLDLTMVRAEAQGIVTLVWHIDTTNASVKYDVQVDNWRWANASHVLVLDMLVKGKNLRNETGARMSVGDAGYISWDTTAKAGYADGTNSTLSVRAMTKPTDDDDHDDDDKDKSRDGGHLLLVFDGQGGYSSLDYDPVFGVQSSDVSAVPGPGVFVVIAVAVGVAVAFRRR